MLRMFRRVPMALSAGAIAVALAFDPYLPSVSTLLHGGTASNITDDVGNIITNAGVVSGNAINDKYGYFNGSSNLNIVASPTFDFGTGDFTIESWFNTKQIGADSVIWSNKINGTTNGNGLTLRSDGSIRYTLQNTDLLSSGANTIKVNKWHHVAYVRSGTTAKLFLDGILVATGTDATNHTTNNNNVIGKWIDSSVLYWNGYIDSVRITKGVARYTTSFTPVNLVMNSNDPYWNQTVLAINFESGIIDLKGNAVSNNGAVVLLDHPLIANAPVMYFSGAVGCKLTYPLTTTSSPMDLSTGSPDFTIEFWMNASQFMPSGTQSGVSYILCWGNGYGGGWSPIAIYVNSTGQICAEINKANAAGNTVSIYTKNNAITLNTWNHIAYVKQGTIYKLFLNGSLAGTITSTVGMFLNTTTPWTVGQGSNNTYKYNGYISDLRITKNIARYNEAFIPPTRLYNDYRDADYYWDSTTFLLSGKSVNPERGGAPVSSGGIIVSQAQSKTGDPAIYYDGANRLEFNGAASDFVFPGNFTIEGWVYKSGLVGAAAAGDAALYGVSNGSAHFAVNVASSQISVYLNTGTPAITFNTTTNYMLNAWHHIALSRVGTTVYLLLDGAVVGTATASGQLGYVNTFATGGLTYSAYHFNGYLQAFRITNGVGRYQASFSNTTLPLPNYVSGLTTDLYWKYISLLLLGDSATPENGAAPVSNWGGSISNSETKTGGGSLYFDGTRRIDLAASTAHVFTGDFTLETWVKKTGIVGARTSTTDASVIGVANGGAWFGINMSSNQITVWLNGSSPIITYTGAANSNMNVWQHIAVVRLDGTVTLYLNGVAVATAASSGTVGWSTSTVSIGGTAPSGNFFNGYIQNVRLSKNVGRYRGNFTPPVYKFPITG